MFNHVMVHVNFSVSQEQLVENAIELVQAVEAVLRCVAVEDIIC